ncbi:MAG: LPS-assembly protein LptD [Bacteroidia bacterium]|nr:LPS-assembly protein LptD [Bacteroidia bacterium]
MLLISLGIGGINAQTQPADTLKKVSVDTLAAPEEEDVDGITEKVNYKAEDSIVALPIEGKALLYGKARVEYGSTNIEAEFIELDYNKNLITAYGKTDSTGKLVGNPVFKDGDETMEADKIMYNLKSKRGKIYNALTKQGELLVVGKEIKKDSLNNVYFKDMRCIPCQDVDSRTAFKATKAKAIPDDKIVTGPMFLEVGNVPTPLGLPFGFFPNTRKPADGIIFPTFGNSAERGFNLREGGYYFGFNDKTDMILKGDIYANGSWVLNATNRYNILYKSVGQTFISYSQFNIGDKDIPSSYSQQRAYEVRWQHTQDNKSNPSQRFGANVNYVKNQSYNRFNAVNSGQYLTNTFQSNINFTKTYKFSSLSINATHSQNSITKRVDITLPSLTYNVNRFFPFKRETATNQNALDKLGINYILEARNTLSGFDSTIFKGITSNRGEGTSNGRGASSILDSMRYGVKHSLPISTNFNILKYITATPALNLTSVMYMETIRKDYSETMVPTDIVIKDPVTGRDTLVTKNFRTPVIKNRKVKDFEAGYDATFSTAFATKVYMDYLFKKGKVKQIRHLLIPTLTYNYRPDFGEEQYGFWRKIQYDTLGNKRPYSIFEQANFGGPGIGKTNGLSLGLNNNLEAKIKQTSDTGVSYKKVVILQNLGINGSYNFAADSFKMSNISVSARTVLFKYFDITAGSNFNPYVYDKTSKRDLSRFVYNTEGRLARLTSVNININTSIGSNMLEALKKTRQPPDQTNGAEIGGNNDLNSQEQLPWNLRLGYILTLTNPDDHRLDPDQKLSFTGDIMPTKFWKVGISTNFDFVTQKLTYTSVNIYRDLKCWEARIDWVPFGPRKSYSLTINLKSSMLSDFKIPKRSIPRLDEY